MTKREQIIHALTALIDENPKTPEEALAFLKTDHHGQEVLDMTWMDVITNVTIHDTMVAIIDSNKDKE